MMWRVGIALVVLIGSSAGCRDSAQSNNGDSSSADGSNEVQETLKKQKSTTVNGPTGKLVGYIRVSGEVGSAGSIDLSGPGIRDREYCSQHTVPDESLAVGPERGLKNCFVFLRDAPEGMGDSDELPELVFDQQECRFIPHAMIVRTGQTVRVLNGDPIGHNTHTLTLTNSVFNQRNPVNDREGIELVYRKRERGPIQIVCDVHPWMRAYHLVVDHPVAALTDDQGRFEITRVPAGSQRFRIWHERSGYLERGLNVEIEADAETEVQLEFSLERFEHRVSQSSAN